MLSLDTFTEPDVSIVYLGFKHVNHAGYFTCFIREILDGLKGRAGRAPRYNPRDFAGRRMVFSPVAGVIAAALVTVGGCASPQPIYNVNAPLPAASRTMSMSEVQSAIQRAGASLGWYINPHGPGHLVGRLPMRTHLAVVDIEHDTKSYSIKYRESANLNAGGGMIHPNYNEWVQSLDRAIRSQLLGL